MPFNLETLVPFDRIIESPDDVFDLVDTHGQVVLLRNNAPAYIVMKAETSAETMKPDERNQYKKADYTLQEAMQLILRETEGNQMHAADLADAIYQKGLYLKKDGSKAEYNQIRARCGHYPDMFEALPGNNIKLKETWLDECLSFMNSLEIGKEYKTEDINKAYRDYGGARSEPYPSDYCYNTTNAGVDFSDRSRRLFEKVGHGIYKYLGPNYPYNGKVTRTDRNGRTSTFGTWENGTFFPAESNSNDK